MHQLFIDGGWEDARTESRRDVVNPATLRCLGAVPQCDARDVERAVAAARGSLEEWSRGPAQRRADHLCELAARVRARGCELATLLTEETGKPLCEASDCIAAVAAMFDNCAARVNPVSGSRGVVAVIAPFNLPLLTLASCVAPAIAEGHSVVCKPPPQNPLSTLKFAALCDALPKGVINVITGGAATGHALIAHRGIDRVSFTGSAEVAARVAAQTRAKFVDLEAGALDAFVVCKDADLELCVPGIAWERLMTGGQVGAPGKHLYVERSIASEFVERMHQYIGFLEVDDPIKPATDLGPLISLEAAHRVEDQVGRALRAGAKLILGGRRFQPSGLPGHFFQPTILTDVRPGSAPTREEILGPVITISPVQDLSEALDLIRESGADAAASVYGADSAGSGRIGDGPFGGLRHRGIRKALYGDGILGVAAPFGRRSWWFPYLQRRSPGVRSNGETPGR